VEIGYSPTTWSNFSPRATLQYKPTDNSTIYFSYSKGFKSGELNVPSPKEPGVGPETLEAYEVGFKATLFGMWRMGLAGFHYNYDGLQVARYSGVPGEGYLLENAASSRIDGVDLDTTVALTRELSFNASFEALPTAKYASFAGAGVYVYDPTTGGLASASEDLSGHRMMRAARFSGNVGVNYDHRTSVGTFSAFTSWYYTSPVSWDPNGLILEGGYGILDVDLGYAPAAVPNLKVVLWGNNLTNHYRLQSALETNFAAAVTYGTPRQYGLRAELQF
jgi:iron complex outermembrane receptor protein